MARRGGYPPELFEYTEDEESDRECVICKSIVRKATRCCNDHLFCAECIGRWLMEKDGLPFRLRRVKYTNLRATNVCPYCTLLGQFRRDLKTDKEILARNVQCPRCNWIGPFGEFKKKHRCRRKRELNENEPPSKRPRTDDTEAEDEHVDAPTLDQVDYEYVDSSDEEDEETDELSVHEDDADSDYDLEDDDDDQQETPELIAPPRPRPWWYAWFGR